MATLNQNEITFNNINFTDYTYVGSVVSKDSAGKIAAGKGSYVTNAVTIDWNGAQLGNKVDSATLTPGEEIIIQTTGQLLSYMSTIAQKLTNLENILINL